MASAWYVLSVRDEDEDGIVSTTLIAWDRDLGQALETLDGTIESIVCMIPSAGSTSNWVARDIVEVWRAEDSREPDGFSILLIGSDGSQYSGMFGEINEGLTRQNLIGRVSSRSEGQPD